jgi:hypothetical protein
MPKRKELQEHATHGSTSTSSIMQQLCDVRGNQVIYAM